MAEAAIEKIKKDILSCCICSDELRDPIGLPCLHVFCYECMHTWHQASQDKTQVVCPACKKFAPVPKGGIRDFPRHTLVKDLTDTIHIEAAKSQQLSCSVCSKQAESHCVDCNKSLCPSCLTNHNTFTKGHKLVSAGEYRSGPVSTEGRTTVSTEGRVCEVHEEQARYYCETEDKQVCMDCISLKTCPIEHVRITLKEAAKKHISSLEDLIKKCAANKKGFEDAVAETDSELDDLNASIKQVKTELIQMKQRYIKKVEQVFDQQIADVDHLHKHRIKAIERKKNSNESGIGAIDGSCEEAGNLISNKVEYLITHKYPTLSKTLDALSTAKPLATGSLLGHVKFEAAVMEVPPTGRLVRKRQWKLCDQFFTQGLNKPQAIAINHDGDIAVGNFEKGVKIYSTNNEVKHSFLDDQQCFTGIVVSNDNRYIVSNGAEVRGIQYYDKNGKHLSTIPATDTRGKKCNVNSVAVDPQGRIVAGLVDKTISIHYSDGSLISKFATKATVYRLAITSKGHIAVTFLDMLGKDTLQLMDYSGTTLKIVTPPPNVTIWAPGYVCCTKYEIFVANESSGNPLGVFRYTTDGDYLGCVTKEVTDPRGIALSQDGLDLFVVERKHNWVKVFHRE